MNQELKVLNKREEGARDGGCEPRIECIVQLGKTGARGEVN